MPFDEGAVIEQRLVGPLPEVGVSAGQDRTSSSPMAQFTARSATSIVQAQLTAVPTGLASMKSASSCAISSAKRSSPVSRYA